MRALISLSDKTNLDFLAKELHSLGCEIISTGGTCAHIKDLGIPVREISEVTGSKEILGGRVKTLHPSIYGGILYKRDDEEHKKTIQENNILDIDLVVVNLYPFEETIAVSDDFDEAIENIDIGGVTLIRAAAKNFQDCLIVVEPSDYGEVIEKLRANQNTLEFRKTLMQKAFGVVARYDSVINQYMSGGEFGEYFSLTGKKVLETRYGENPHQKASLYANGDFFEDSKVLKGEISFNNLLDINACIKVSSLFREQKNICIVKHNNPCGFAIDDDLVACFDKALICDKISAYGGVASVNAKVELDLAKKLNEIFLEVVIAPSFSDEALQELGRKKRIKLVQVGKEASVLPLRVNSLDVKFLEGGFLVQEADAVQSDEITNASQKSKASASTSQMQDLSIAYKIASVTKSNCIVYVKQAVLVAIGMGMTSRVDATKSATRKAQDLQIDLSGSAMASEAFFPFRDSIDEASQVGVSAIIQPGGSIRDDEVVQSADEHGMALYFTGVRHFLH